MKVKLQKIIDVLYEVNDDNALYLDTEAGEIVHVYDGGVQGGGEGVEDLTPDEIDESERFIFLPSSFDLNNWQIMQNFICSLDGARLKDWLSSVIHRRSGALRNFMMENVLRMNGTISRILHIVISQQKGVKGTLLNGQSENIIPEIRIIFSEIAQC